MYRGVSRVSGVSGVSRCIVAVYRDVSSRGVSSDKLELSRTLYYSDPNLM